MPDYLQIARTDRTALIRVELDTNSGVVRESREADVDSLLAKNENFRKSMEARRKLLSAIERAGAKGVGRREWWRSAKVSGSTLQTWLPKFLEQKLVIEDRPGHYVFNDKPPVPVTLSSFTARISPEPSGEPYQLVRIRRGRLEFTKRGQRTLDLVQNGVTSVDHRTRSFEEFLNKVIWDGIRRNVTVDIVASKEETGDSHQFRKKRRMR